MAQTTTDDTQLVTVETFKIPSAYLSRLVQIDFYIPLTQEPITELLLINDGQDLPLMPFNNILSTLYKAGNMQPVFCAGIYCGADRKNEYGTALQPDYKGYGSKAGLYIKFIFRELLPFIKTTYPQYNFIKKSFAGFSLGGLSALDITWNYPKEFTTAGVFSGSLWWRKKSYQDGYDDNKDRIMHQQIKTGAYNPRLKFFFECGALDEVADRNNNGIIDAIEDTRDLITELLKKGYKETSIKYVELQDGRHDVSTWARAFPEFLKWNWGSV